jgi:vacuolar-type H+-ATPase subunit E/Vma4
MAVEDILEKIRGDAEEVARRIVAEGEEQAGAVTAEARARIESQRERMRAKARQRAEEERNRIVTLARLSGRRELLGEKQRLIDSVFEETKRSIIEMDRAEYRRLIKTLFRDTREAGESEVIVDVNEKRIDQGFLDEVAGELKGNGGLTLSSERREIGAGFILRRGRTETNCTVDTILRGARERLETEVAAILFGTGDGGRIE